MTMGHIRTQVPTQEEVNEFIETAKAEIARLIEASHVSPALAPMMDPSVKNYLWQYQIVKDGLTDLGFTMPGLMEGVN